MSRFEQPSDPEKDNLSLEQKRVIITNHLDTYMLQHEVTLDDTEVEAAASTLLAKIQTLAGSGEERRFIDEARELEVTISYFPEGLPGESSDMKEEGAAIASVVISEGAEKQGPISDFRDAAYYIGMAADDYDIQVLAILEERLLGEVGGADDKHPRASSHTAGQQEVASIIAVLEAVWQ